MIPSKNGVAAGLEQVALPASILQLIAEAASHNGEMAQRLVGFVEGRGHDVNNWSLVIESASMQRAAEVSAPTAP